MKERKKMEITRITEENLKCFRTLLTSDLEEKLSLPGYYGIGALTGERPKLTIAGVLVFHICKSIDGDSDYAELEWINVSENKKRNGAGRTLVKELKNVLSLRGVESVYADLPVEGFSELKDFFRSEGFLGLIMDTPVFEDSAEHLQRSLKIADTLLGKEEINVFPLAEMELPRVMKQLRKSILDIPVKDQEDIFRRPVNYYDQEVSFVHESNGVEDAFILIHVAPSGVLVVDYYGTSGEASTQVQAAVLSEAIKAVVDKFGKKVNVVFPLKSEEEEDMLGMYLPHLAHRTIMRFASPANDEEE